MYFSAGNDCQRQGLATDNLNDNEQRMIFIYYRAHQSWAAMITVALFALNPEVGRLDSEAELVSLSTSIALLFLLAFSIKLV